MDELDRDVADIGARRRGGSDRHQPPSARETLGHPVAAAGHPIGLGLEEAPIRLGALGQQGIQPPRRSDGQTAAASRAATPESHSAKASVPSPVLALTSRTRAIGLTVSRLLRIFSIS